MFFIFSMENEQTNFGRATATGCAGCGRAGGLSLVLLRVWLCIFFVRIFVYREVWSLECQGCGGAKEVTGDELNEAKDFVRAGRSNLTVERAASVAV